MGRLLYKANNMRDKNFHRQELLVRFLFRLMCVFLICLAIVGIYPNFIHFLRYMRLETDYTLENLKDYYMVYVQCITGIALYELLFILILGTALLYMMRKYHRDEFKENRLWIVLFGIVILLE